MKNNTRSAKMTLPRLYTVLHRSFGYQNWWPIVRGRECLYLPAFRLKKRSEKEVFEIMIGALLTQNTSWGNVVKSLILLKENKMLDIEKLAETSPGKLSPMIRSSGYFNQKAKKIKTLVRFIISDLKGEISRLKDYSFSEARKKLLSVWGIGRETADSILLYGYSMPVFVVDAYTRRIFSRLGCFNKNEDYDRIRDFFESGLKKDPVLFQEFHALIVELGKNICKNKPLCGLCPLNKNCLTVVQ